jgi:hypothetical protein
MFGKKSTVWRLRLQEAVSEQRGRRCDSRVIHHTPVRHTFTRLPQTQYLGLQKRDFRLTDASFRDLIRASWSGAGIVSSCSPPSLLTNDNGGFSTGRMKSLLNAVKTKNTAEWPNRITHSCAHIKMIMTL